MKKIISLLSVLLLLSGCASERLIKKVEIKETGYHFRLSFEPTIDVITNDDVIYKITPVSADDMNAFFIEENTYNGELDYSNYETSRDSYFIANKKQPKKVVMTQWEFFIEGLNRLYDQSEITKEEYFSLSEKIRIYYDEDEEYMAIPDLNRFIVANPYYIDNKYLNLFKVDIFNPTDQYKELSGTISIEVGDQLLYALNMGEISGLLEFNGLYNYLKHKNLLRYNLNMPLKIPATSHFSKYIATLPIDYNNNELFISTSGYPEKAHWNIKQENLTIDELLTYYVFRLKYYANYRPAKEGKEIVYDHELISGVTKFNILTNGSTFSSLDGSELYIDENHLNSEVELFTITIYNGKFYYGRNILNASNHLDLQNKSRRSMIMNIKSLEGLELKN